MMNAIKNIVLLFFCLVIAKPVIAQADLEEARVKEIRAMYGKSQEYLKTAKNCRERTKVERKSAYEGGESFDYPQKYRRCDLPEGLSVITGTFSDWEWDESISFFQEEGDVYFVFIVSNDVSGTTELRVYFDLKGRLIRLLEKSDHGTGKMSDNVRVTDQARIQSVYAYVKKRLTESQGILD
jgi:hypothetical protein